MTLFKKRGVRIDMPMKKGKFPSAPMEFPRYESLSEKRVPMIPERTMPAVKEPSMPSDFGFNQNFPDLDIPNRLPSKIELINPEREDYFKPRMEEMPMRTSMDVNEPIYVKIESYKNAVGSIRTVKQMLAETESILGEIQRLKVEEDKQISRWYDEISNIKAKLMEIDRTLFEYK